MKLGRELAGSAEHWITTQPSLRAEMFGFYGVLRASAEDSSLLSPQGTPEAIKRAWAEFDETVELFRTLMDDEAAQSNDDPDAWCIAAPSQELRDLRIDDGDEEDASVAGWLDQHGGRRHVESRRDRQAKRGLEAR